ITATGSVLLRVGDDVSTPDIAVITAGTNIDIFGDFGNADPGFGTNMDLRGTITPRSGAANRTSLFGHSDVDTFNLLQIKLGGQTNVFGSATSTAPANAAVNDGEDRFFVDRLQTMNTFRAGKRDTLNLDGQADTDTYLIINTGSTGAFRDYII